MSFLKKLFGGGSDGAAKSPKSHAETSHEGYQILATPISEGGQYRVSALIRKEVDGEMKEHTLIRADMCSTADDASDIALRKARQMIDERGDALFGR